MALTGINCFRVFFHDLKLKGIICGTQQSNCWTRRVGARRHLLSEDVIKLQEFQKRKLAVALKHGERDGYLHAFREKLQKRELVLRDELKLLLHLCNTPDDVDIAKQAIERYHEENQSVPLEYKFGPVFMRLCYEFSLEQLAANTITDKRLKGFFSDSTSFNLVMDMLFTKGNYESALEVLLDMRTQGVSFNKDSFILAFAICYKLNTAKSYRVSTEILEEAHINGQFLQRHAYCFAVALALKQKDVEKAKSLHVQIMNPSNRLSQNLHVCVLAQAGDLGSVFSVLLSAVAPKGPTFVKKLEFSQEVLNTVHECTEGKPAFQIQLDQIVRRLELAGQVTSLSLDEMLCYTPSRQQKAFNETLEPRVTSRRTRRPLRSTLLSE